MYQNDPQNPRPRYGLHESEPRFSTEGGKGWLWVAGVAVLVLVALFLFGGTGGDTTGVPINGTGDTLQIESPGPSGAGVVDPIAPPPAGE